MTTRLEKHYKETVVPKLMEKFGFVQLTKVQGGFIAGSHRRAMDIPGAPRALPLICYEAIFPADVASRDDRPGWIINSVGFAGPRQRYTLAMMNSLNGHGGYHAGTETITQVAAILFRGHQVQAPEVSATP